MLKIKNLVVMRLFVFIVLIVFLPVCSKAQTVTYTTLFIPHSVTYNGSDDPGECWESVDFGILIETGERTLFFLLPAGEFEKLRLLLKDQKITVDVIYYEEPTLESGVHGSVLKITCQGKVVYSAN